MVPSSFPAALLTRRTVGQTAGSAAELDGLNLPPAKNPSDGRPATRKVRLPSVPGTAVAPLALSERVHNLMELFSMAETPAWFRREYHGRPRAETEARRSVGGRTNARTGPALAEGG
jgi:hypothetical protein